MHIFSLLFQPHFFLLSFNRHEYFNLILIQIANVTVCVRLFSNYSSVCKLVHLKFHSLGTLAESQAQNVNSSIVLSASILLMILSLRFPASIVIHHFSHAIPRVRYRFTRISIRCASLHTWIIYVYT